MAIQTTSLDSKLDGLEQKATEYDTRTNTEQRVDQAEKELKNLNRALRKLENSLGEFERQAGILTEVFEQSLPPGATGVRRKVREITDVSQNEVLNTINDGGQSLSSHIEKVRGTGDEVKDARKSVDDELKDIQKQKLADANTAKSIQKLVGENPEATRTISQYRSFLNSILNPKSSVPQLKSQWQRREKSFQNLDTDWEGFRQRHGLSQQTIEDLKKLSREGEVDLDDLSDTSVSEMLDVPELRSTIKVSL